MKLILALLVAASLVGCVTTKPEVKPTIQLVEVPVPYWPEPNINELPKTAGIEFITDQTSAGDVVKHYLYEVEYWKSQSKIYRAELAKYEHSSHPNLIKTVDEIISEMANGKK